MKIFRVIGIVVLMFTLSSCKTGEIEYVCDDLETSEDIERFSNYVALVKVEEEDYLKSIDMGSYIMDLRSYKATFVKEFNGDFVDNPQCITKVDRTYYKETNEDILEDVFFASKLEIGKIYLILATDDKLNPDIYIIGGYRINLFEEVENYDSSLSYESQSDEIKNEIEEIVEEYINWVPRPW